MGMSRQVILTTAEGIELEYTLAGVGSRFLALFVDTMLQGLLILAIVIIGSLFAKSLKDLYLDQMNIWLIAAVIIVIFLILEGYYIIFETSWNGSTPGKRAAGLRVIRDDGFPLDFRGAVLRNVMRVIDFLPALYGVGVLCIFFNRQHRRLGDMVAGTLVVREREDDAKAPVDTGFTWQTAATVPAVEGDPLPLELLTPQHIELAETFLRRRQQLPLDVRQNMAIDVARRIRAQLQMPPEATTMGNEQFLEDVVRGLARRAGL